MAELKKKGKGKAEVRKVGRRALEGRIKRCRSIWRAEGSSLEGFKEGQ